MLINALRVTIAELLLFSFD